MGNKLEEILFNSYEFELYGERYTCVLSEQEFLDAVEQQTAQAEEVFLIVPVPLQRSPFFTPARTRTL